MKIITILVASVLLCGSLAAQCVVQNGVDQCVGPLAVMPPQGNTTNSGIAFTDLLLTPPAPATGVYWLSVVNKQLQESDNGGAYHTLVGPQGPVGATGATGATGSQGPPGNGFSIGTVVTGTLTCPKSKGTIAGGFTTANCTFTITGLR